MALQSNAALLDELMGKFRNDAPGSGRGQIHFDDDEVCKHFLVMFCPHELFVNTRADLGPCSKIHDEEMRNKYRKSSRYQKLGYEEDFERFLRNMLGDVERKIRRGQERIKLTQNDTSVKTPLQIKQERLVSIKEQINNVIKEAERMGEEGQIDEAQEKLQECEELKLECKHLENQIELSLASNTTEQKQMEVCNVCGSFLIINDSLTRMEEHNNGKQHQGYARLRDALEELRQKRIEEIEKREKEREKERRDRERERDRRDRREKSRDRRDRSRDRSRDRDARSKTSSSISKRDRPRENSRDRARDSGHRDKERRDRDQRRSSRNRSRTRSRSRDADRKRAHANENGKENDVYNKKKSRKLEEETDAFLKLVDDLTSKNERKEKRKRDPNEEREEGEETSDYDDAEN